MSPPLPALIFGWATVGLCLAALLALGAELSRHIRAHIDQRSIPPMPARARWLALLTVILLPLALRSLQ